MGGLLEDLTRTADEEQGGWRDVEIVECGRMDAAPRCPLMGGSRCLGRRCAFAVREGSGSYYGSASGANGADERDYLERHGVTDESAQVSVQRTSWTCKATEWARPTVDEERVTKWRPYDERTAGYHRPR